MSDVREVINHITKRILLEQAGLSEDEAFIHYDELGRVIAVQPLSEALGPTLSAMEAFG